MSIKKWIVKGGLGLVTVGVIVSGAALFSAFEAHIVNVTATIENALDVPVEAQGLSFGNVFPEQVLHKNLVIDLSQSFLGVSRLDDVEYMIRQKPKCGIPVPNTNPVQYSGFAQVTDTSNDINGTFVCPAGSVALPLLCPYLSKHELDANGQPNGNGIDAFHGPLTGWTMADTLSSQVNGRLSKADQKTTATWDIDLHAPCFKGQCAQDNVVPANYQADPANQDQMYGCDLWVEVTNFSLPPEQSSATLTVTKIVSNTHGGNNVVNDFQLFVSDNNTSTNVLSGVSHGFNPGTFFVSENGVPGYQASYSGDCDVSGQVTLSPGDNKHCILTNSDLPANITLTKVVDSGAAAPASFSLTVDGNVVPQNSSVAVTSNTSHSISENPHTGYHFVSITGDAKCPSALAGTVTLNEGESLHCTIHNTQGP